MPIVSDAWHSLAHPFTNRCLTKEKPQARSRNIRNIRTNRTTVYLKQILNTHSKSGPNFQSQSLAPGRRYREVRVAPTTKATDLE